MKIKEIRNLKKKYILKLNWKFSHKKIIKNKKN